MSESTGGLQQVTCEEDLSWAPSLGGGQGGECVSKTGEDGSPGVISAGDRGINVVASSVHGIPLV